jgi:hypothetical protein
MSESFTRLSRAKSLLIDFLLTSVRLPHGDNPRCPAAPGMGYRYEPSGKQAQSDKPFLCIIEAVIYEGNARTGKHQFSVREIQAMLGKVAAVLGSVPFKPHSRM